MDDPIDGCHFLLRFLLCDVLLLAEVSYWEDRFYWTFFVGHFWQSDSFADLRFLRQNLLGGF